MTTPFSMRLPRFIVGLCLALIGMSSQAAVLDVAVYTPFESTQQTVVQLRSWGGHEPRPLVTGNPSLMVEVDIAGEMTRIPVWFRAAPNGRNDLLRVEYAVDGKYPINIPAAGYAPGYGPTGYLKPGEKAPPSRVHIKDWGMALIVPGETFEIPIPQSDALIRATLRLPPEAYDRDAAMPVPPRQWKPAKRFAIKHH